MPLLEAIVGTHSNDLYDVIFDVDATPEEGLFNNLDEDEGFTVRSISSSTGLRRNRSRGRTPGPGPIPATNVQSPPMSPTSPTMTRGTPDISPARKPISISTANLLEAGKSGEMSVGKMTPLARLFTGDGPIIRGRTTSTTMGAGANIKKIETLLEEVKNLPVNKVTEEIRELQVWVYSLVVNVPSTAMEFITLLVTQRTLYVRAFHGLARHCRYSLTRCVSDETNVPRLFFFCVFLLSRIVKRGLRVFC